MKFRALLKRTGSDAAQPDKNGVYEVLILGAGFAGICMGARLKQRGSDSFIILEKSDGVGGTWRDNHYPGAACDVQSHLYSLSFARNPNWSRKYSPQKEILTYLETTAQEQRLGAHLRFGEEIERAAFDENEGIWRITTTSGVEYKTRLFVTATGQLNRPILPEIAGLDRFEGESFHSARWNHEVELAGKRVAVIGSGASAIQFLPAIAAEVGELELFQRSANWVVPKMDGEFSERAKKTFRFVPLATWFYRKYIYFMMEKRFMAFRSGAKVGAKWRAGAQLFLDLSVADKELREKLQPDHPLGCKRILISNEWYPALQRENVTVTNSPITEVTASGIRTADGTFREVDVLIYATGFAATEFLAPMAIHGAAGAELNTEWQKGAEAYLGMTIPKFPNLFMLYGPNTNLGHNSVLFMIECQVSYILKCLSHLRRASNQALEVKAEALDRFNDDIQKRMENTVWDAGCQSWYKNADGKVINNWPDYTLKYWLKTRRPRYSEFVTGSRSSS